MTFQAGVPGNDWTNMIVEATTEVLKLGSSSVALLFQALLHFVTKMAARSVFLNVFYYPLLKEMPEHVACAWVLLRQYANVLNPLAGR